MFGGSLFSWPFWRKPPAASDDPAPANGSASPAGTPPAPRPPPGRPPPAGVGGPEPGEELRREAGRAF
jgi:hypothetical protein